MSDTLAGANMKMVMRDDFPADGDQGDRYALSEWMQAYANDLGTEREVTKLVEQIEKGFKFNLNESPDLWNYTGQRLKSTWEKIPERRRGGGTEYLTHKLLEKVYCATLLLGALDALVRLDEERGVGLGLDLVEHCLAVDHGRVDAVLVCRLESVDRSSVSGAAACRGLSRPA